MDAEQTLHARSGGSLFARMKGAAFLDVDTYEEVEHDSTATAQAAGVVAMVAVARAVGALDGGITAIVGGAVSALVGWLVWAGITYVIGDKIFDGTATWGELLRTLGFAQAPGLLLVLAIIPILGWFVQFGVGLWILVAGVIAVRQALDFGTGKAIGTVVIGWFAWLAVAAVVWGIF